MTEIPCLPAQGVPDTWFLVCISSCSARCALVSVTRESPGTEGSGSVPRMCMGGGLEKLLGIWQGTARASESVGQFWAAADSVTLGLVRCFMACLICLCPCSIYNKAKSWLCRCKADFFSALVDRIRIRLYMYVFVCITVVFVRIHLYIVNPDKYRLQHTGFILNWAFLATTATSKDDSTRSSQDDPTARSFPMNWCRTRDFQFPGHLPRHMIRAQSKLDGWLACHGEWSHDHPRERAANAL